MGWDYWSRRKVEGGGPQPTMPGPQSLMEIPAEVCLANPPPGELTPHSWTPALAGFASVTFTFGWRFMHQDRRLPRLEALAIY